MRFTDCPYERIILNLLQYVRDIILLSRTVQFSVLLFGILIFLFLYRELHANLIALAVPVLSLYRTDNTL
jgi:hypothetical protein